MMNISEKMNIIGGMVNVMKKETSQFLRVDMKGITWDYTEERK